MDGDRPSRSWWVFLMVSGLVVVALLGVVGMRRWNRAPAVGQEREEPAVALELVPAIQNFIDICHGSTYDGEGRYVRGPSQRGLHQFGVVLKDGQIQVDVGDFRVGPAVGE